MGDVKKTCACGRAHTAEDWEALEYVGTYPAFDAEGDEAAVPPIEMRNCSCGSTISVEVSDAA